jgi:hypothetical protein
MPRLVFLLLVLSACSHRKTLYNGIVDDVNCHFIAGWAMDWSHDSDSIDVRIYDEGGLLSLRVPTTLPRENFRPGADRHGFQIVTPAVWRDGKSHFIHVDFEGSPVELRHSPRPLNCPSP